MQILNRLKKLRQNMGLTGEDVASRAGIAYSTYSKIEKGKSKPSLETALKISRVLRVQIETIFKLDDESRWY